MKEEQKMHFNDDEPILLTAQKLYLVMPPFGYRNSSNEMNQKEKKNVTKKQDELINYENLAGRVGSGQVMPGKANSFKLRHFFHLLSTTKGKYSQAISITYWMEMRIFSLPQNC